MKMLTSLEIAEGECVNYGYWRCAIGNGTNFYYFGIRNGIHFHDVRIRNGINFQNRYKVR